MPDYAEAHYNLGVSYRALRRRDKAIEAFKRAIRINPDYAEAHYSLGELYKKLGRMDEAEKAFNKAKQIQRMK